MTDRTSPWRKIWRTVGEPRLVVIGSYAMGFEILAQNGDSRLLIWIDYDLPRRGWARYLPALAAFYAKWCVRQMIDDAIGRFGRTPV